MPEGPGFRAPPGPMAGPPQMGANPYAMPKWVLCLVIIVIYNNNNNNILPLLFYMFYSVVYGTIVSINI